MLIYYHSHHKCASRWASHYLQEVALLNYLSFGQSDLTTDVVPFEADLGFFGNSFYDFAHKGDLRGVHFVRNPLNIIVSAYFSHRNNHSVTGWDELAKHRRLLRQVGVTEGLFLTVTFLERADIKAGMIGPLFALRNWNYDDPRFKTIRVEDVVQKPSSMIHGMLPFSHPNLPPDWRFTFEAFSGGRAPGMPDEHSHYRSGDPEDWKKHLPLELIRYVQTNMEPLLSAAYPEILSFGRDNKAGRTKEPVLQDA